MLVIIGDLLDRIATLYQVPGWTQANTVLLSEWIMEAYPYETLETIQKALAKPLTGSKVWRLTPDTITEWMTAEIEREAIRKEKEIHNQKHLEESTEGWTDERLLEWQKVIDQAPGMKPITPMTAKDILREGQVAKKEAYHPSSTEQEHIEHDLRYRYGLACYDVVTGKPNASWVTFEEWKSLGNEK